VKLDLMRPLAEAAGLTPLQLACAWNLAQEAVACAAPTLIQEAGPGARPIADKRRELAELPAVELDAHTVERIREIGDNTGSMALKGASPDHDGEERPDRWALSAELAEVGRRWGVDADRDLTQTASVA
jgi:Ser/Thr protein kinase RdoA (MazF antagonist)